MPPLAELARGGMVKFITRDVKAKNRVTNFLEQDSIKLRIGGEKGTEFVNFVSQGVTIPGKDKKRRICVGGIRYS